MRPTSPLLEFHTDRGVKMGKNKFTLKWFSGKIKCVKTMFVFFLMENQGIEDPPSQLNGKFHYLFIETVPNQHIKSWSNSELIKFWVEAELKIAPATPTQFKMTTMSVLFLVFFFLFEKRRQGRNVFAN